MSTRADAALAARVREAILLDGYPYGDRYHRVVQWEQLTDEERAGWVAIAIIVRAVASMTNAGGLR